MSPNLDHVTVEPAAIFLPPTEPIDITALIAAELHRSCARPPRT